MIPFKKAALGLFICSIIACKPASDESTTVGDDSAAKIQLQLLSPEATGVSFANTIQDEGRINIFTWHFIYNGAGVAAGDINNDGLPDLYFTGNQVPDKLYLNKGNFQFEDITSTAGILPSTWSSGVTMADVNADGLMDIYVCRNSPTGVPDNNRNKLYINQGKNIFREQAAQYGLDDIGFSTQATFFDADQDGDLDMYLVNQPFDEFARLVNKPEVVAAYTETDRFFFNENGKFVDRIEQLGMKDARYGLNATIGDFDRNGWTDIYICNDYHHGDFLYLNTNGKFTESAKTHTGHTSFYSMGSDLGDINADGWPDMFTLDMAYEDHHRSKTNMGSMDIDWFWSLVDEGHHYQYMQNVLLTNQGNGYFSDMAQIGGIAKSDWSFATLFADLDHDADQDILVTNGVYRDMRNNDFNKMVKDKYQGMVGPNNYLEVLKNLPSTPISNIIYNNEGDMRFTKMTDNAGFGQKGFSHGMAYADLNNDGLLDVIINNQNAPASIYKNTSTSGGNYIAIHLEGPGSNKDGLGCTAIVHAGGKQFYNTVQTTRGYFSAVEPLIHVGLGDAATIDSIEIFWDHKSMTVLREVKMNERLNVRFSKEKKIPFRMPNATGTEFVFTPVQGFKHQETAFNDYKQQVLMPYKLSQGGPFIAVADVNGDQREDFFIGAAAGFASSIYTQSASGAFIESQSFDADKDAEDLEGAFGDFDGDGDNDLLVTSGSNEFADNHPSVKPRLYMNDGKGKFAKAPNGSLPDQHVNGQCIELFDADGDKDLDAFVGGRLVGGQYAVSPNSHLWINTNGKFIDETTQRASFLQALGMVTDAIAMDADADGDMDMLTVGEWMTPTWMINDGKGHFTSHTIDAAGAGLWWTVDAADFDKDGDLDVLGNLGWNNKFGGAAGTKLEVFANDFDQSGDYDVVLASQKNEKLLPVRGRECTSQEMPFILDKYPTYEAYASAQLQDIYSKEQLAQSVHKKLSTMASLYLQNDGGGNWTAKPLPLQCQVGPLKAFSVADINSDGHSDFMYGGNHFPTEVETARYDGLFPGVCYGDGKGNFECKTMFDNGKLHLLDVRDIRSIKVGDKTKFILGVNDGQALVVEN